MKNRFYITFILHFLLCLTRVISYIYLYIISTFYIDSISTQKRNNNFKSFCERVYKLGTVQLHIFKMYDLVT